MYSWKVIRIACSILLLLPLVHVTWLMSRDTLENLDHSPDTWDRAMEEYAKADSQQALPEHPIVVVGGRSVRLWAGLEEILAPRPVLMRGLGDAIIEDISLNYARLVGFYRPHTLVLLPGNGEFFIRDNKSAEDLLAAVSELATLDAAHSVTQRLYIYTPLKTPLRPQDHGTIDEATALLTAWAANDPRVTILNANALLANRDGAPKASYFRSDGFNLNEHGYLRLAVLLHSRIEADETSATTAAPAS